MTTTSGKSTESQTIIPYLCASGADEAIIFYQEVFGATVEGDVWREQPDGRVGHCELQLGGMRFFVSDEYEALGVLSPQSRGGTTVSLVLIVDDVDGTWARAVGRGATVDRDITVARGVRSGWLLDPWGHRWNLRGPHRG